MSKKVGKRKLRTLEKLMEDGEKAVKRTKRNAILLHASLIATTFMLGFFISSLKFSFVGLENIGYNLLWITLLLATFSLALLSFSSLSDYYEYKFKLEELKEEYKRMEA